MLHLLSLFEMEYDVCPILPVVYDLLLSFLNNW